MKSFQVVLVITFFTIIAVKAGGDIFLPKNFLQERSFDDEDDDEEKVNEIVIFLPRCRFDENGKPTKEVTGSCIGRCRKTKLNFMAQSPDEEDACCCVNWDRSRHANH